MNNCIVYVCVYLTDNKESNKKHYTMIKHILSANILPEPLYHIPKSIPTLSKYFIKCQIFDPMCLY